jgi:hypothetical protein
MGSPFSQPVNQLGCVVPDLDQAIQGWVEVGVGPWLTMHHVEVGGYQYEGRSSKPKIDLALRQNHDLQIELIHPANDEPSDYKAFLDQGRVGMHHLGWFCETTPPPWPPRPPRDGPGCTSSTTSRPVGPASSPS